MEKPLVVVSSPMHPAGFELMKPDFDVRLADHLTTAPDEFRALMKQAQAVVVRSLEVTRDLLLECPNLKVIVKHGAGVDNIDVSTATELGIVVANSGPANACGVAEGALAMVFAALRELPRMRSIVTGNAFMAERAGLRFRDLSNKTVGVVGFGNIGRHFARMVGRGFDARVLAFDTAVDAQTMKQLGVERVETLDQLLSQVDVLSLHASLTPQTHHIIGARELAMMKSTAIVINTARGGLIDEYALAEALRSGAIQGAGIDVFEQEPPPPDHPLFSLDNVILTPHCAGGTDSAAVNSSVESARAVIEVLQDRPPPYPINPQVRAGRR